MIWNGDNGTDVFFQNEMPYDPPSQAAWMASPTSTGYPAFLVTPQRAELHGYGMGSYSFFNQGVDIFAIAAFLVPNAPASSLHDLLTRFLNGSGGIDQRRQRHGRAVDQANPGPSYLISYP